MPGRPLQHLIKAYSYSYWTIYSPRWGKSFPYSVPYVAVTPCITARLLIVLPSEQSLPVRTGAPKVSYRSSQSSDSMNNNGAFQSREENRYR
eukprot:scaffold239797_cov40-Prasinocladus_malaysianus.AAC.1